MKIIWTSVRAKKFEPSQNATTVANVRIRYQTKDKNDYK